MKTTPNILLMERNVMKIKIFILALVLSSSLFSQTKEIDFTYYPSTATAPFTDTDKWFTDVESGDTLYTLIYESYQYVWDQLYAVDGGAADSCDLKINLYCSLENSTTSMQLTKNLTWTRGSGITSVPTDTVAIDTAGYWSCYFQYGIPTDYRPKWYRLEIIAGPDHTFDPGFDIWIKGYAIHFK